jgi:hypothetical protein
MVLRERTALRGRPHAKDPDDKTSYVIFRACLVPVNLAECLIPRRRRPEFRSDIIPPLLESRVLDYGHGFQPPGLSLTSPGTTNPDDRCLGKSESET